MYDTGEQEGDGVRDLGNAGMEYVSHTKFPSFSSGPH